MFKKILSSLLAVCMLVSVSTSVLASSNDEEKPMLPYFFNDSGMYKLTEEQFDEVTIYGNLNKIIQRDNLVSVDATPTSKSSNWNQDTQEVINLVG